MSNLVVSQAEGLAKQFNIAAASSSELLAVLKATAFKGQVSNDQLTALLIVAKQYGLNPWTKEIYAFPDRNNGIVPVVGVDGWSRIINTHPAFDGMEYEQDDESCTCIIYRKDRAHPVKVTEYMAECRREGVGPWKSHPKRMLRHKATIQCARLAFGFVGIYEQDEAERIVEGSFTDVTGRSATAQAALAATIPEDSPERDEAIRVALDVASLGTEAFRAMWKEWTPDRRKLVTDQLPRFQAIAAEADAAPVEDAA
jgi:phage recombination protein Bet